jgi:N-acetylmuramic acid 6-phosphate (MurNAc-6-P) etherase
MIDMQVSNNKLYYRSHNIISAFVKASPEHVELSLLRVRCYFSV